MTPPWTPRGRRQCGLLFAVLAGATVLSAAVASAGTTLVSYPPQDVHRTYAYAVNAFSSDASGWLTFEWGQTTAYGNQSTTGFPPSPPGQPGMFPMLGLSPGTTYHYRLAAQVGPEPYTLLYGNDISFQTLPAVAPKATVVSTNPILDCTCAWVAANLDLGGLSTDGHVEYGLTSALGLSSPTETVSPVGFYDDNASHQFPVTSLIPGATYYYSLVVSSPAGSMRAPLDTFVMPAASSSGGGTVDGGGTGSGSGGTGSGSGGIHSPPGADLRVEGDVTPGTASVGGTLTWTIRVTALAGASASNPHVEILLPEGLSLVSARVDPGRSCTQSGTMVHCALLDLWRDAATATILLVTTPTAAGTLALSATAAHDRVDPVSTNDRVTLSATVLPPPARALQSGKTIIGTAGRNTLDGTARADTIRGLAGNDTIRGLAGADRLYGGSGDDLLVGGLGGDTIDGGTGNDLIRARDGQRDTIRCGAGNDTVEADRHDSVSHDCEHLRA
jgi:uncharacterized repeat protein (TIGR01451 family)